VQSIFTRVCIFSFRGAILITAMNIPAQVWEDVAEGPRELWSSAFELALEVSHLATRRFAGIKPFCVSTGDDGERTITLANGRVVPEGGFASCAWTPDETPAVKPQGPSPKPQPTPTLTAAATSSCGDLKAAKMGVALLRKFICPAGSDTAANVEIEWRWQPNEIDGMVEKLKDKLFAGELLRARPPHIEIVPVGSLGERLWVYDTQGEYEDMDGDDCKNAFFDNGFVFWFLKCVHLRELR